MEVPERKLLAKGLGAIFIIPLFYIAVRYGCYLPGFPGELFRFTAGFITSPFLMESTIALLGITVLFWINGKRRQRESQDEFISREDLQKRNNS